VLLPERRDPNVSFKVWIKAGSMNDPAGKEGLALVTAQLLAEGGTERMPYDQILAALYPLAAGYGASVDKEMTVFSGSAHRDHAATFASYFTDAMTRPRFAEADFERVRDSLVSTLENTLRYSSDEELGKAALYGQLFNGTPYAHVPEGTVAALKALTVDDVRAFYGAHYTRDNIVLALGGAYDAELEAEVSAELGRLPAGAPASVAIEPPGLRGRSVQLVEKKGDSTAISFGFPID
ncbi:MAG: insulinase family protein, partial [Myxococcales bacterium]|nr:insulinase family protein [Myxococcales bacterium]